MRWNIEVDLQKTFKLDSWYTIGGGSRKMTRKVRGEDLQES